ncbi:orotidine-5'-phosphate decarboxylase [Candidatus Latescibacterota bacterium]
MSFIDKVRHASQKADSLVCVGLDTDLSKIPGHLPSNESGMLQFNEAIISATSGLVCAYKPNSAFYEAQGSRGIEVLIKTCEIIPLEIPVILDVKRGDIGNTASCYASFAYDIIGAEAVTVNPYMGFDAVRPFLRDDKCVFVLCITSNPTADEFQTIETGDGMMFERVARAAVEWSKEGEIGIVAGATKPEYTKRIRDIVGNIPILVPGVGAQGGDPESVVRECGGKSGTTIINSSRGILYASDGTDFSKAARSSLDKLRKEINRHRRHKD